MEVEREKLAEEERKITERKTRIDATKESMKKKKHIDRYHVNVNAECQPE